MSPEARQALRKHIRQLRRSLPAGEQARASAQVCEKVADSQIFRDSNHIAFFLAADGEVDLTALLVLASTQGKHCYLPVSLTDGSNTLRFLPWQPGDALCKSTLGVLEPATDRPARPARELDLVLTPLVAFDERGFRMGMGKGFYDRSFAFKREAGTGKPVMIGIAHECQRMESLDTDWWDVPLDAVITAENVYGNADLLPVSTHRNG